MPCFVAMIATMLVFFALLANVVAFDDAAVPCHNGECYYRVYGDDRTMFATVKISGPSSAISDITNAAGWEILDCPSDNSTRNIRLVCLDDDFGCSHIFEDGAEHTIVRLPPHCGKAPFARVSKAWVSKNKSIPSSVRARMKKRAGGWPSVHALSLDNDYNQALGSNKGNVLITIYASTSQDTLRNSFVTSRHHARDIRARGIEDVISGEFDIFSSLFSSEGGTGPFLRTSTRDTIPISVDQQFNVFNMSLPCSGSDDARLSVDADVNLQGEIDLGVIAQGTIVPPKFDKFGLFGIMSADLAGKLSIATNLSGEVDSPGITFFSTGLPGFSIPDIISLGPSISLAAKAAATFDINMNMGVGLGYGIRNLTLVFPPSLAGNSSAVVVPTDIPLQLSVAPGIESDASFTAHLIPSLNLGLVAFDVTTAAFLKFDTSATLDLSLNAGANSSIVNTGSADASADVSGCADANGGIVVSAGLEANSPLFDLLGDAATIKLAEKNIDFFQDCFPDLATPSTLSAASPAGVIAAPRSFMEKPSEPFVSLKRDFACPAISGSIESMLVNRTLSSASFRDK